MEQKLSFLRKYNNGNVKFVTIDELSIRDLVFPKTWVAVLGETDMKIRIAMFLDIWKRHSGIGLSNTISYLSEYLQEIELIEIDGRYSILYTIKNRMGKTLYYEGRNPLEEFQNKALEEAWTRMPHEIREFYTSVHNGFFDYTSESMGLVPRESVTYFDDYEWGILEELNEPIKIDLKTTFGFFSNGMGTYVAIDTQNCSNGNATLWSSKKQPRYNINFWDVVDEWTVIGFDK